MKRKKLDEKPDHKLWIRRSVVQLYPAVPINTLKLLGNMCAICAAAACLDRSNNRGTTREKVADGLFDQGYTRTDWAAPTRGHDRVFDRRHFGGCGDASIVVAGKQDVFANHY
jgi:hypothetical protein